MSTSDLEPQPPPLPRGSHGAGASFFSAVLLTLAALYVMLKITLEITRAVKPIYMETGTALPLVTVQAMALVEGALKHGRLYLGVPPLFIAAGYVMLAASPRLRRACVAGLMGVAILLVVILTLLLTWPLLAMAVAQESSFFAHTPWLLCQVLVTPSLPFG